jgi:hypothetical protein
VASRRVAASRAAPGPRRCLPAPRLAPTLAPLRPRAAAPRPPAALHRLSTASALRCPPTKTAASGDRRTRPSTPASPSGPALLTATGSAQKVTRLTLSFSFWAASPASLAHAAIEALSAAFTSSGRLGAASSTSASWPTIFTLGVRRPTRKRRTWPAVILFRTALSLSTLDTLPPHRVGADAVLNGSTSATRPRLADVVGSRDASPYQDQVCRPSVVAFGREAPLVQHLAQVSTHAIISHLSGKRRAWRLVKLVPHRATFARSTMRRGRSS